MTTLAVPMTEVAEHHVYVAELADSFGPRRRADRPNVWVGVVKGDRRTRFEHLRRSERHPQLRDHAVRLRTDLTRNYPATTAADAKRQRRKVIAKLKRQGYTVNGDTTVWRLYVIELHDAVGARERPDRPWVYVGLTSKTPEERFEEHRTGARTRRGPLFSRVVHRHGLRLRPDLYEREPVRYSFEDGRTAEEALAERLRRKGYSVKGGT